MSTDLVYAVTLSWNRKEDTLGCLASLLTMDPQPTEVILVDNGSSDGTPGAVAERFPQVRVLANEDNLGFAGGINVGLRVALKAGAAYILMVNNDTLVSRDLLGLLVKTAEEDQRIGIVTPKIYYTDPPDRIWYAGGMRRRWWPGFSFPGYGKRDTARYTRRRDVELATGCGLLVRAAALRKIGLFDETLFFMYHEDLDLSERIRQAGYRIVYEPQARMWHKESASTAPMSQRKWYYLARYIVPYFERYYRWPVPALALYTLYVILRELLKGHARVIPAFCRGILDGVKAMQDQHVPRHDSAN